MIAKRNPKYDEGSIQNLKRVSQLLKFQTFTPYSIKILKKKNQQCL